MPGTLLRDDWQSVVGDTLKQHAQNALTILQDTIPRPQAPDPNQIQQQLQDYAQQAQQQVQQALVPLQQQPQQVLQQLTDHASGLFSAQAPPVQPSPAQSVAAGGQPLAQQLPTPVAAPIAPSAGAEPLGGRPPDPNMVANYIRQAAAQRGIDSETAVRVAASEGLHTYVGDNNSSFGPFQLHYGGVAAGGNAVGGLGDAFTAQTGLDARDPSTWPRQVDFALDQAKQSGWGAWHGAQAIGVAAREGLEGAASQARGAIQDISQFGDNALTNAEAYAACGPAAAVRFAERFGRNPTLREAVDLAKQVGWSVAQGMAGITSQKALMDKLGVATRIVGPDVSTMAQEAQSGNPVTISTPGHYFYADGYDPRSGAFHVGRSGTDLRGGKEWMTSADMEGRMGAIQGALLADSPLVPSKSAAAAPTAQPDIISIGDQQAARYHGAMIPGGRPPFGAGGGPPDSGDERQGLQIIGDAVGQVADDLRNAAGGAVGGFFSDVGKGAQQAVQDVGEAVEPARRWLTGEAQAEARARGYSPEFEAQAKEIAAQPIQPPSLGDLAGSLIPGNPFFAPGNAPGPSPVRQQDILGERQKINQAIEQAPAFQNWPVPVAAGVGIMATQMLFDPMTYVSFGPASAAGRVIGEGITEATGRQLLGRITTSSVTNGLLNASFELQKSNPDPMEVGKQFGMGLVGGPILDFAPAAILKAGQALIARADDLAGPQVGALLRSRQPAQANAGFAVGLGPGQDVLHGQAVPRPGYEPGTPEHTVETFLQTQARAQGTPTPTVSPADIAAQPGMAGTRSRGLDEVRHAVEVGLPAARWFQEMVQQIRRDTGEDINPREAAVLMGAFGGNAGVPPNYHGMLSVFDAMRQANPDLTGLEHMDVPGIMATQAYKDVVALIAADKTYINRDMLARVMRGYRTGEVPVPSGAKLSSYTQDFLHALNEQYAPYSTQDVWQGRLFGARPDLEPNGKPVPNVSENDAAYRTMHALTNWVAREMHLPPDQAQATGWTVFRTLWNDKVIGPELRNDRIGLSDAIRQGQQSGILDPQLMRTGSMAEVTGPRTATGTAWIDKIHDVRDRIRANGSFNTPAPESATALNEWGLLHPSQQGAGGARGTRVGGIARPVGNEQAAALRELALGDQPVLRVPGEVQVDPQTGKIPWLAPEHTVQRVGDHTYVSVVGVGDDAAHLIGQRLGADRFNHADYTVTSAGGISLTVDRADQPRLLDALQAAGLPVLRAGDEVRVPLLEGKIAGLARQVQGILGTEGVAGSLLPYSGATHAVERAGQGGIGGLGNLRRGAAGPSGVPAGDRLRAAIFRDEPVSPGGGLPGATGGRQPGQAYGPFSVNVAGGVLGGAAGSAATPEDAPLDVRLRNIGLGALTGLAGSAAITRSGPGRLAEAIAGRARTAPEPARAFRAPERPELRTTLQEPPGASGGVPREEPGAPRPRSIQDVQSNPYGLREPRPGETPMSTDDMVSYADELDARLEDVQNRANAVDEMLRNPARKVERPPWGAGYTNVQLAELARRHDISPYQENWWDKVGLETGSGEVRENVGESNLRGTPSQRELSTTDLRAEKTRLDKEAADILAAHDQMASAPAGAQLVRPTQAAVTPPGELPFDMPGAAEQTPEPVPATEAQGGRDEGARLAQEVVLSKGRGRLTSTPGEVVGEQGDITGRAILSPERAAEVNATPPSARTAANMPNLDAMLEGDMPEVAAQIRKAAEDNPELFEKYRQGVISFDSLRNDLAARTGMAMKDWLKTPVGKGFNEREMMALQAAAIEAQGRLQDMGDSILARGGVDALTPEQVAYGLAELVDTQRLLAVARGGRSTAGRTLNVLKQRFDRTLASSITAGAEAIAKRRDAQTARRAAVKATRLLTKGRELEVEGQTAVANASRTPGTPRNIVDQIAEAYEQLDRYQAMTLHEKGDVATQLAKERAARVAARKAAVANRGAPEELLSALKAELKAEQDIFAGRKDNWETQAFWDTKANEIAAEKRNAFRGQLYLEQQRRVAQIAAKEADQGSKRAFDAELRRKTNQSQKAEVLLKAIGGQEVGKDLLKQFLIAQADPDPYAAAKFIKGMASQNNWVRANIIRVAGLVSAPITHMVNLGGNTALAMVEQVAVRPTVVLIDAVRAGMTGGERQAHRAELLPAMQAYGPGFLGALPNAVRLLKTGIHPADTVDLAKVRPGFGSGSDVVDAAVEMPLRALGAEDILFRSGAVSYHGMRVGMRQAIREGFRGEAAKGRAANILKNLEEYPELAQEVHDAAARDVFQEKRGIGRLGFNESQNVALARSQVLPFVRTPMNITAQGAAMSPLGMVGTVQAARASRVGMTAAQSGRQTLLAEERLARTLIGTGIFGAGLALGGAGMLTADYPQDRTTLPPGWRPWSMKLDDPITSNTYYVPLQNIGPMGFPLAMSAILTDPLHQGKTVLDPDEQMNAATAIGRYVIDNTFLQGINDFNDLLHDPRQGAAKFAEPWAASFGPYSSLMRELNRTFGVASRNPHEGILGLVDAMEANYPGLAGNVPEATTALGEPRTQGATGLGRLVPLRYDIARDEPLLKQLREAGVPIPQAPKAVNYASGHIELSEQEQDQLKRARGAAIRKAITSYTNDPQFQALSRDKRNYYLRDLVSQATAQANMQFLFDLPEGSINSRWKPREIPEPYYLGGATG